MVVGDLVRWNGKLWLVSKIDAATSTAILESGAKEVASLGAEEPCELVCQPILDWPSITLPPRQGRLTGVYRAGKPLVWLEDWLKMDSFQMGGALFLNPALRLGYGHRLTVSRNIDNARYPVDIPRDFVPSKQKLARKPKVAEAKRTTANLYDHLMEDE